jgi:DNA-binding MarR family transcriptional regulator
MEYEANAPRSESWLMYGVAAIMRKASDRALAPLGLSIAQMPVLVILRDAKQPIMITEVARRLCLETPSLTTMIDRLSERGLVKRVEDPKDRRKALVALTQKGECLVQSACEPYRLMHDEMFGVLDDEERENLTAVLQKFYDANLYLVE